MTTRVNNAKTFAKTLIGLMDDVAMDEALREGFSARFVVMEGSRCGKNSDVSRDELCLFGGDDGRVFKVVVGSHGIYDDPDFLAAPDFS